MLAPMGRKVDAVLAFDVDNDEIVQRLSATNGLRELPERRTRAAKWAACATKCGGTLIRRKDDDPEAVRTRLASTTNRPRRCSIGTAATATRVAIVERRRLGVTT